MRVDLISFLCLWGAPSSVLAWVVPQAQQGRATTSSTTSLSATSGKHADPVESSSLSSRRHLLVACAGLLSAVPLSFFQHNNNNIARAEEESLTTQLFNPDGSLKEGEVEQAKFRKVEIALDSDVSSRGEYSVNVDGKNTPVASADSAATIKLVYQIPEKWDQTDGYYDKSTSDRAKTCERIMVYRAPGKVSPERLAKATTIGLAEALYVPDDLKILKGADLISGRTRTQTSSDGSIDIKFYDFDLAVAPKTCSDSAENLGLGFCPFDAIYLLSAAVLDDALYVIALQCDKKEWKVANADLKRVRSSFAFDLS